MRHGRLFARDSLIKGICLNLPSVKILHGAAPIVLADCQQNKIAQQQTNGSFPAFCYEENSDVTEIMEMIVLLESGGVLILMKNIADMIYI
jgi:hypothetical protein